VPTRPRKWQIFWAFRLLASPLFVLIAARATEFGSNFGSKGSMRSSDVTGEQRDHDSALYDSNPIW